MTFETLCLNLCNRLSDYIVEFHCAPGTDIIGKILITDENRQGCYVHVSEGRYDWDEWFNEREARNLALVVRQYFPTFGTPPKWEVYSIDPQSGKTTVHGTFDTEDQAMAHEETLVPTVYPHTRQI